MNRSLEITLPGGFSVALGGQIVQGFESDKARALPAYPRFRAMAHFVRGAALLDETLLLSLDRRGHWAVIHTLPMVALLQAEQGGRLRVLRGCGRRTKGRASGVTTHRLKRAVSRPAAA